jgi:DUF2075 family protein
MIVYLATKEQFRKDVDNNDIEHKILTQFKATLHRAVGENELRSWANSMAFMDRALADPEIPEDAGVAIEFVIPQTAKRIDFVITGLNEAGQNSAVIVELKQWQHVESTEKDGIVRTFVGGSEREMSHPSYQAWSYAALLEDYNESVREIPVLLHPCAYLHNCTSSNVASDALYAEYTRKAPVFLKSDAAKLRDFIRKHVKAGDGGETMYRIKEGRIRPSKSLADSLESLLKGNREFVLIDEQKVVYETAIHSLKSVADGGKIVLIVDGGPGTGKSVIAINLLVAFTKMGFVSQYVTKNAAPRTVYESKLTGSFKKSRITNLFTGSGAFTEAEPHTFDALIVDEAHRLNERSGLFSNMGENQVLELIRSSRLTIFFIDEDQRVTLKDIGRKTEIRKWAEASKATVHELSLQSQFRCNGSDGYLSWVDNVLQIRETANPTLDGIGFEFQVFDSPRQMQQLILERNRGQNKSRIVAGYCWDWISKKDSSAVDIRIPEHSFSARWNLASDGNLWILKEESVNEIGCIHTCQGLELEYIGVIIGPDLVVRDGVVQTRPEKRARTDSSLKGFKALMKRASKQETLLSTSEIIKNTYRTLMTRAQKGCFVFSVDPETNQYFKDHL